MPSKTPESDAAISKWPEFSSAVEARLRQGRIDYGDSSFHRELPELLDELKQECLDLAGWGYLIYRRLCVIESCIAACERVDRLSRLGLSDRVAEEAFTPRPE
jgi:hypothetical protein